MNDAWEQHVLLEISDAYGNIVRLRDIQEALMAMWEAGLMPDELGSRVWLHLYDVGGL